jgi:uncharacterized membrane protein YphA (DoxX/SURF4 family)
MTTLPTSTAPAGEGPSLAPGPLVDPTLFARGMAVLRIFFGVILFSNGLAKLIGFTSFSIGPYSANLIDRDGARGILEFEANTNNGGTRVPGVSFIVNDVLLPNWGVFQWAVTFLELGVGLLLIVGLATRGAALVGLGQQLFLALLYASSNRWAFEQPHEYVPLIILSLVPAGRVWGLDREVIRRRPQLRRWPF